MSFPIVGIVGKAGSGKGEVSKELTTLTHAHKVSLSTPLKQTLIDFFPFIPSEYLFGESNLRSSQVTLTPANAGWTKEPYYDSTSDSICFSDARNLIIEDLVSKFPKSKQKQARLAIRNWLTRLPLGNYTVRALLQSLGTDVCRSVHLDVLIDCGIKRAKKALMEHKSDFIVIDDVRFLNEALAIKAIGGRLVKLDRPDTSADSHISETELEIIPKSWFDYRIINDGTLEELHEATAFLFFRLLDGTLTIV